jgi:hypothetical protein
MKVGLEAGDNLGLSLEEKLKINLGLRAVCHAKRRREKKRNSMDKWRVLSWYQLPFPPSVAFNFGGLRPVRGWQQQDEDFLPSRTKDDSDNHNA